MTSPSGIDDATHADEMFDAAMTDHHIHDLSLYKTDHVYCTILTDICHPAGIDSLLT